MIEFLREITPGAWGIFLILALLAAEKVKNWREDKKLSVEERMAKREGFTAQVEILLKENRDLRHEYDEHRRICFAETQQLRDMVVELQDEVQGLKRKVATQAYELAKAKGFDDGN